MVQELIINKTMDLSDLKTAGSGEIIADLDNLIRTLRRRGLNISTWYGRLDSTYDQNSPEVLNRGIDYKPFDSAVEDRSFPWFLYWEIAWVIMNGDFKIGQRVLDLGGSSSLFSFYLASKGFDVTTIDLQENLVENANCVAQQMGWELTNYVMDMNKMDFPSQFDQITSICVYEHIPVNERVRINKKIAKLLVPGGRFSITFDYKNPSRSAKIGTPGDVYEQFVKPSGLAIRGNESFLDNRLNYLMHPFYNSRISLKYKLWNVIHGHFSPVEFFKLKRENDYTFGALFLEKK